MYSTYYRDLIAKGVINKFCVNYVDTHRAELKKQFKTDDDYVREFDVTPELMDSLIELGKKEGVEFKEDEYKRSKPMIEAIVKGLIGRDIFEQATYSKVVARFDPIFTEAVGIINSPERYNSYLTAGQK